MGIGGVAESPCSQLLYLRLSRRGRDDTVTSVCASAAVVGRGKRGSEMEPSLQQHEHHISQSSSVKVVNNCERSGSDDRSLLGRSPHCHHLAGTCQIQSVWIPIGGHYLQQIFYRAFYACLSIAEHILLTLTCLPLRNFLLACGMWGRSVRLLECNGLSFGRRVVSAR